MNDYDKKRIKKIVLTDLSLSYSIMFIHGISNKL
jgi:hypothetical protein